MEDAERCSTDGPILPKCSCLLIFSVLNLSGSRRRKDQHYLFPQNGLYLYDFKNSRTKHAGRIRKGKCPLGARCSEKTRHMGPSPCTVNRDFSYLINSIPWLSCPRQELFAKRVPVKEKVLLLVCADPEGACSAKSVIEERFTARFGGRALPAVTVNCVLLFCSLSGSWQYPERPEGRRRRCR